MRGLSSAACADSQRRQRFLSWNLKPVGVKKFASQASQ